MALQFRKGGDAIVAASTRSGNTSSRQFLTNFNWKNDGEQKYGLILTPMEEVVTVMLHQFIPVGKGTKGNGEEYRIYEEFISRKDPAIGERHDDLEDRLERQPKERSIGVMVELEPIMEGNKVKSFQVKTSSYTRRQNDEEVEVLRPEIGFVTQSPRTLWGTLESLYRTLGDLTQIPILITRRGKDQNTRYDVFQFTDKPVDLSPVWEYLDGINYIKDEDVDDLINGIEAADSDVGKVQVVSDYLLNRRLDELADGERYKELVGPLHLEDFPPTPWGRKQGGGNSRPSRPARPERPSQRPAAPPSDEPAAEAAPSRNERFQALRNRVQAGNAA